MHKFLLAENPMAPESSGVYIIHLPDPVMIVKVDEGYTPGFSDTKRRFTYLNPDGVKEKYTLSIHHMFSTDFLEVPADRAFKMLDKAWHWYKSYLQWEDINIDNEEI